MLNLTSSQESEKQNNEILFFQPSDWQNWKDWAYWCLFERGIYNLTNELYNISGK